MLVAASVREEERALRVQGTAVGRALGLELALVLGAQRLELVRVQPGDGDALLSEGEVAVGARALEQRVAHGQRHAQLGEEQTEGVVTSDRDLALAEGCVQRTGGVCAAARVSGAARRAACVRRGARVAVRTA